MVAAPLKTRSTAPPTSAGAGGARPYVVPAVASPEGAGGAEGGGGSSSVAVAIGGGPSAVVVSFTCARGGDGAASGCCCGLRAHACETAQAQATSRSKARADGLLDMALPRDGCGVVSRRAGLRRRRARTKPPCL